MKTVTNLFLTILIAGLTLTARGQSKEVSDKTESTDRQDYLKSVHLYPNPAVEFVSIKFDEPLASHTKVAVHNIIGSFVEVEQEQVDDFEIRLRVKDLPVGYYFLALRNEASNQRGTFKFLKR